MAENTNNSPVQETEAENTAAFTTETNSGAGTGTSTIAPGYGTGRRKEAVARVRLIGHRRMEDQRPHARGVLPVEAPAA